MQSISRTIGGSVYVCFQSKGTLQGVFEYYESRNNDGNFFGYYLAGRTFKVLKSEKISWGEDECPPWNPDCDL